MKKGGLSLACFSKEKVLTLNMLLLKQWALFLQILSNKSFITLKHVIKYVVKSSVSKHAIKIKGFMIQIQRTPRDCLGFDRARGNPGLQFLARKERTGANGNCYHLLRNHIFLTTSILMCFYKASGWYFLPK